MVPIITMPTMITTMRVSYSYYDLGGSCRNHGRKEREGENSKRNLFHTHCVRPLSTVEQLG